MKNEIIKTIETRRSSRGYKDEQITDEELKTILDAGMWAPSGKGAQSPIFVAVQDKDDIEALRKVNAEVFGRPEIDTFFAAPTVVVVLAKKDVPTALHDGCAAITTMCLAASSIGVGSCWIHRAKETFESEIGKGLLQKWGIEDEYIGIGNCILGYENKEPRTRLPRKENYYTIIK